MAKRPLLKHSGSIIPKGDGKWMTRWYVGLSGEGKRIYNAETITGTYAQAQMALRKKLTAKDTGVLTQTSKLTLCEYLTGYRLLVDLQGVAKARKSAGHTNPCLHYTGWLGGRVDLSGKTHRGYCDRVLLDILPLIGHRKLDGLSRVVIQDFVQELVASPRGLSRRTIQYTMVILKMACAQAVEDGLLGRNPCAGVVLPKQEHHEPEILSGPQMVTLLTSVTSLPHRALWTLLLTAGLRPQEALALTWGDLEVTSGTLTIRRAMIEVTAGVWEVGVPKTASSIRSLIIPRETVDLLLDLKQMTPPTHLTNLNLVFSGRTGYYLDLSALRRHWKADLVAAGLPPVKLYGARHSHATLGLSAGIHIKVMSERLGHATTKTTLDTYSHVLPSMQQAASDTIGAVLFPVRVPM